MKLLAKCPRCGSVMKLSAADADKRLRCKQCGRMFKVPELTALKGALEVLAAAASNVFVDEAGNIYG